MLTVADVHRNVFLGSSAGLEFLRPDNSRPSPMIEITDCLRANASKILRREISIPKHVRFLAKAMTHAPLFNVKQAPAFEFMEAKMRTGELEGKKVIIAPSSGSFVYSLGLIAPHFGNYEVVGIVPGDLAPGKELMLKHANVFPWPHQETLGNTGIDLACRLGQLDECIVFNQYQGLINPLAHEKYTAPQIEEQTDGKVCIIASGMGTSGTLRGCFQYFEKVRPGKALMAGGYLQEGSAVPGIRTWKRIEEQVKIDYMTGIRHFEVDQRESYMAAQSISRYGVLAGASSGSSAVVGLKLIDDGLINEMVNSDGEVVIVVVLGDLPLFILEKFTQALGPECFPQMPKILLDRLMRPVPVVDYNI